MKSIENFTTMKLKVNKINPVYTCVSLASMSCSQDILSIRFIQVIGLEVADFDVRLSGPGKKLKLEKGGLKLKC